MNSPAQNPQPDEFGIHYPVTLQPSYSGHRVLVVDAMDNCLCDIETARRHLARRIVACLNVCRDISTEKLEFSASMKTMEVRIESFVESLLDTRDVFLAKSSDSGSAAREG